MGAREVIEKAYAHYGAGRLGEAFSACADDFRFSWVADPNLVRHTAAGVDRIAFLQRVDSLHALYIYHSFEHSDLIVDGERVAAQVVIDMTHRESGRRFLMPCAHFWTVRGEEIVELVEYFDTALAASLEGGPD